MLKSLAPEKLDEQRTFNDFERQTTFFRDKGFCQFCKMNSKEHKILWEESQIHHVTPHSAGGVTEIDNGALVHRECHPKNDHDVEKFRNWWCRVPLPPPPPESRRSGLRDYLIPVVRMIMIDGKDHTGAFKSRAHELGVQPSTVNSQCTRSLGFIGQNAAQEFVESVHDARIVQIAKDIYPDKIDCIDRELAPLFRKNNG